MGDGLNLGRFELFAEVFVDDVIVQLIIGDAMHGTGRAPLGLNACGRKHKHSLIEWIKTGSE